MKAISALVVPIFTDSQKTIGLNVPLLVLVLTVLLTALWICIWISKKNRLYIKPEKEDKQLSERYHGGEVTS